MTQLKWRFQKLVGVTSEFMSMFFVIHSLESLGFFLIPCILMGVSCVQLLPYVAHDTPKVEVAKAGWAEEGLGTQACVYIVFFSCGLSRHKRLHVMVSNHEKSYQTCQDDQVEIGIDSQITGQN